VSLTFALFVALSLATFAASWSKETKYKLGSRLVIVGFLWVIFGRSMVSEAGYCTAFTDSNFLGFAYVNGPLEKPDFRDDRQYIASLRACAPKRADQMAWLAYGFKLSEDELNCVVAKEAARLSTYADAWAAVLNRQSGIGLDKAREKYWHKVLSANSPIAEHWKGPYPDVLRYYLNGLQINSRVTTVASVLNSNAYSNGVTFNHCGRVMDFTITGVTSVVPEPVSSYWRLTKNQGSK
jgi:hypothetical protein